MISRDKKSASDKKSGDKKSVKEQPLRTSGDKKSASDKKSVEEQPISAVMAQPQCFVNSGGSLVKPNINKSILAGHSSVRASESSGDKSVKEQPVSEVTQPQSFINSVEPLVILSEFAGDSSSSGRSPINKASLSAAAVKPSDLPGTVQGSKETHSSEKSLNESIEENKFHQIKELVEKKLQALNAKHRCEEAEFEADSLVLKAQWDLLQINLKCAGLINQRHLNTYDLGQAIAESYQKLTTTRVPLEEMEALLESESAAKEERRSCEKRVNAAEHALIKAKMMLHEASERYDDLAAKCKAAADTIL